MVAKVHAVSLLLVYVTYIIGLFFLRCHSQGRNEQSFIAGSVHIFRHSEEDTLVNRVIYARTDRNSAQV
jgi:hypothetical protein